MEAPKILIAEDEKEIRSSLIDFLSLRIECDIIETENAYDAIEKIESTDIDPF